VADRGTTIEKIAAMLRDLDFGMLTTRAEGGDGGGGLRARPMSNNGEVEFDGDVWFFSAADSRKVREIGADPRVELSYADPARYLFVSLSGEATIVRDPKRKRALWMKELERWFDDPPESEAIVLIKVTPSVVAYWNGDDTGELSLA